MRSKKSMKNTEKSLRGKMKEDTRQNKIITTVWGVGGKMDKSLTSYTAPSKLPECVYTWRSPLKNDEAGLLN